MSRPCPNMHIQFLEDKAIAKVCIKKDGPICGAMSFAVCLLFIEFLFIQENLIYLL